MAIPAPKSATACLTEIQILIAKLQSDSRHSKVIEATRALVSALSIDPKQIEQNGDYIRFITGLLAKYVAISKEKKMSEQAIKDFIENYLFGISSFPKSNSTKPNFAENLAAIDSYMSFLSDSLADIGGFSPNELQSYFDIFAEEMQAMKSLYSVFGGKKIEQYFDKKWRDYEQLLEGGDPLQAAKSLAQHLADFSKQEKLQGFEFSLATMHDVEEITSEASVLEKIKNNKITILSGGFKSHCAPLIFHKDTEGNIFLSVVDRGAFHAKIARKHYDNKNEKGPCVATIRIPSDKLQKVTELLQQANLSDQEEAGKILFSRIPKLTQTRYKSDLNSEQKSFKKGICYYSNFKSVIRFLLLKQYGNEQGELLYKKFTLFERKAQLASFAKKFGDETPLLKRAYDIVVEKGKNIKQKSATINHLESSVAQANKLAAVAASEPVSASANVAVAAAPEKPSLPPRPLLIQEPDNAAELLISASTKKTKIGAIIKNAVAEFLKLFQQKLGRQNKQDDNKTIFTATAATTTTILNAISTKLGKENSSPSARSSQQKQAAPLPANIAAMAAMHVTQKRNDAAKVESKVKLASLIKGVKQHLLDPKSAYQTNGEITEGTEAYRALQLIKEQVARAEEVDSLHADDAYKTITTCLADAKSVLAKAPVKGSDFNNGFFRRQTVNTMENIVEEFFAKFTISAFDNRANQVNMSDSYNPANQASSNVRLL